MTTKLHHETSLWWRGQWESKADQGKTVKAHCLSEYSKSWTRRLRGPDIVLHRPDGVAVVVDVTCPFESGAASLEVAAQRKRTKYDELCVNLADQTKKSVLARPFVVGSLGSYPPSSSSALVALGVSARAVPGLARKTAALAIEGSLRVWKAWNAGLHGGETTS